MSLKSLAGRCRPTSHSSFGPAAGTLSVYSSGYAGRWSYPALSAVTSHLAATIVLHTVLASARRHGRAARRWTMHLGRILADDTAGQALVAREPLASRPLGIMPTPPSQRSAASSMALDLKRDPGDPCLLPSLCVRALLRRQGGRSDPFLRPLSFVVRCQGHVRIYRD
jgi:hypothetical protein